MFLNSVANLECHLIFSNIAEGECSNGRIMHKINVNFSLSDKSLHRDGPTLTKYELSVSAIFLSFTTASSFLFIGQIFIVFEHVPLK